VVIGRGLRIGDKQDGLAEGRFQVTGIGVLSCRALNNDDHDALPVAEIRRSSSSRKAGAYLSSTWLEF
jgi:hypothetical protein